MIAVLPKAIFIANRRWVVGKALSIRNGRIASVVRPTELARDVKVLELPGMALLPGFVNAHTHLEYTDDSFIHPRSHDFVAWLQAMVAWRANRSARQVQQALRRGVTACLAQGTIAVGDHYSGDALPSPLLNSLLKGVIFHEVLGLRLDGAAAQARRIRERKKAFPKSNTRFGIALHAPYSVGPELLQEMSRWAHRQRVPVSIHAAESREEGDLFAKGAGSLGHWLLEKTGVIPDVRGTDPVTYLAGLGLWKLSTQAVHMNLVGGSNLRQMHRERTSIAYCPKSHAYFDHPPFPLKMFLEKGFRVALGTDSLASNDSLDMLSEMRMARSQHPHISLETLWDMATTNGSQSLGLSRFGNIQKGAPADLLALPIGSMRHPLEEVLEHQGTVPFLMIGGKVETQGRIGDSHSGPQLRGRGHL